MNFLQHISSEGAPFYEQKELRSSGEHLGCVLRMAHAERLAKELENSMNPDGAHRVMCGGKAYADRE